MRSACRRPLFSLALSGCVPLLAQDLPRGAESVQQPPTRFHEHQPAGGGLFDRSHLTGDWFGGRSWLERHGLQLEAFTTTDASLLLHGGVDRHGTALRTLLDVTLTVDTEAWCGWRGGTLFADFQLQRGDDGSDDTGDLQRYSNIDEQDRTQLAKLWLEQQLIDGGLRLRLGKSDTNADFDVIEHGANFLHASFGHSPTLLAMPTYPDPSFGAALLATPGGGVYANLGVYDGATQAGVATGPRGPRTLFGAPSDLYLIGEVGLGWGEAAPGAGAGRAGVGIWHHTGDFDRHDGGVDRGTTGAYGLLDQQLLQFAGGGVLGGFLMYGWADPDLSPFEHHLGGGLQWSAPFAQRPDDAVGLGCSWASFSDRPAAGMRGSGELAIELYYQLRLLPWLTLQPDLQWIDRPGGRDDVDDALVLTLRTSVVF